MQRFVLIGGLGRSGTSLTRRIIGSHSVVSIPPRELKFFEGLRNRKTLAQIFAGPGLGEWNIDFSDLYHLEPRDAYVRAILRYQESIDKAVPGEKTPHYEFYYDILQDWLQDFDVKFIHLVRNPFDALASQKYFLGQRQHCDVSAIARNWRRSASMGAARALENPTGYYLLRFEDLAADPITTTRNLCAFLELNFEQDRMLTLSDFRDTPLNTSFDKAVADSHGDFTGIHFPRSRKEYLTRREVRVISAICGELARALGYEEDEFQTLPPERLRCWNIKMMAERLASLR